MKRLILLILGCISFVNIQAMDGWFSRGSSSSQSHNNMLEQILELPADQQKVLLASLKERPNVEIIKEQEKTKQAALSREQAEYESQRATRNLESELAQVSLEQYKAQEETKRKALEVEKEDARQRAALAELQKERQKADNIKLQDQLQRERENKKFQDDIKLKSIEKASLESVEQDRQRATKEENNRYLVEEERQKREVLAVQKAQQEEIQQKEEARLDRELKARRAQEEREKKNAAERLQQREEQERRLAKEKAEQERALAEAKAAQQKQLQKEREASEEKIRKENEEARKRILEAELKNLKEVEAEKRKTAEEEQKAKAERDLKVLKGKREDEQANMDYYARKKQEELEAKKVLFTHKLDNIRDTFVNLTDSGHVKKMFMYVGGTTVAVAGGVLAFKHGLPIVRQLVEERLFTPFLIDETNEGFQVPWKRKAVDQKLADLYYDTELGAQINIIAQTLKKTHEKGGYFLNYLFYGPPGTGKTATARALAYESGTKYAIMSGGNVVKLLKSGKAEQRLKEVFKWASNSDGLILFIDEADAFLMDPKSRQMSEELYAAINSFLNLSGTESKKISIIFSTNHPNALAPAVLDRVGAGQFIYFGLPKVEERKLMAKHFIKKYLRKADKVAANAAVAGIPAQDMPVAGTMSDDEIAGYIADKTEGFSGRNISYLVLALEKALLVEDNPVVTQTLVDRVIANAVKQKQESLKFRSFA